jgi:hypothetical protein
VPGPGERRAGRVREKRLVTTDLPAIVIGSGPSLHCTGSCDRLEKTHREEGVLPSADRKTFRSFRTFRTERIAVKEKWAGVPSTSAGGRRAGSADLPAGLFAGDHRRGGLHGGAGGRRGLRATRRHLPGPVTVHGWPAGDWHRSELGETFDGSGTWSVVRGGTPATGFAHLSLSFTAPERFLGGDTLDTLSIAEGDGRTHLYADDDPDVCPAFRLRLQDG